jgi:hypothetical protein
MADTVTAEYVYDGRRRKLLHLTGISDGTGESAVVKADISALTMLDAQGRSITPTATVVDMIDYNIQGYASIRLYWDHTTDDEIAVLPEGSGTIDFAAYGGKVDPRSSGGTGDIILTSNGHSAGDTYDITIHFRTKA